MIISYEMLLRHIDVVKSIQFDLVICDEAHRLKNTKIKTATALGSLAAIRRIALTGTPIQNDLTEFHAIVNWVGAAVPMPQCTDTHWYSRLVLDCGATHRSIPGCLGQPGRLGGCMRVRLLRRANLARMNRRSISVQNGWLSSTDSPGSLCFVVHRKSTTSTFLRNSTLYASEKCGCTQCPHCPPRSRRGNCPVPVAGPLACFPDNAPPAR